MKARIENLLKVEKINCDLNGGLQELIKQDVLSRNDNVLYEKIIKSGKNLKDAVEYCYNEYLQEYIKKNGRTNGGVGGSDSEIVAMAIHYFDEESIAKFTKEKSKEHAIPSSSAPTPKAKAKTTKTSCKTEKQPNSVVNADEIKYGSLFDDEPKPTTKKTEEKKISFGSLFDFE